MTQSSLLSKWFGEYMCPVVVTIATAEAEKICLENGLLFHELISAFGQLDGINASVKSVNSQVGISDAHIRFERFTEVAPKSAATIEQLLRENFEEEDLIKMPSKKSELKNCPPNAWTPTVEQIVMRSISFSEFEMASHPLVMLSVIATTDIDPVSCMLELSSVHHLPGCFSTGQYDPVIHRVYLILHDNCKNSDVDTGVIMRLMKSKFPPSHTKLLSINSLSPDNPNIHHPDIWTRWKFPMFFPQQAPRKDVSTMHINPVTNTPVLGARLSMEDFMALRNFCIELFLQEVLPAYERRVSSLNKIVTDAKKGMKNVLKSFWRKPRENTNYANGVAAYRFDRIEAQILLLADTAFSMRDYDSALSMYRLVRDDFKADKSIQHYAYTTVMICACLFITEPQARSREFPSLLDALNQCMILNYEPLHSSAFFSLIVGELLTAKSQVLSPLEAAQQLLLAASCISKLPLLSALLIERGAHFFLWASQDRKYILYSVLACYRYFQCGDRPVSHACNCLAAVMVMIDGHKWVTLKNKILQILSDQFRKQSIIGRQIALVLILRILGSVSDDELSFYSTEALDIAVLAFEDLLNQMNYDNLKISGDWKSKSTFDILSCKRQLLMENDCQVTEIEELHLPILIKQSTQLLLPLNGSKTRYSHGKFEPDLHTLETLKYLVKIEQSIDEERKNFNDDDLYLVIAHFMVEAQRKILSLEQSFDLFCQREVQIPIGECITMKLEFQNPLPIELSLSHLFVNMHKADSFIASSNCIKIPPCDRKSIQLTSKPTTIGSFYPDQVVWNLSPKIRVFQSLKNNKKSQIPINPLSFEVVNSLPLLCIQIGPGLGGTEVLSGQLIESYILLYNEGFDTATNVTLTFSNAVVAVSTNVDVFSTMDEPSSDSHSTNFLPFYGITTRIVQLPDSNSIPSKHTAKLKVWLCFREVGDFNISIMVSYTSSSFQCPRTSFTNFAISVVPSLDIKLNIISRQTKIDSKYCVLQINNSIPIKILNQEAVEYSRPLAGHDEKLLEGSIGVTEITLLGAATISENGLEMRPSVPKLHANFSEKLTICVPFQLSLSHKKQTNEYQAPISNKFLQSNETRYSSDIMNVFTYMFYQSLCVNKAINACRNYLKDSNLFSTTAHPRSISEVRKERQSLKEVTKAENAKNKIAASLEEFTPTPTTLKQKANNSKFNCEAKLAEIHASKDFCSVIVSWTCKWKGKICSGISTIFNQSLLPHSESEVQIPTLIRQLSPSLLTGQAPVKTSDKYVGDLLLTALTHEYEVQWDFRTKGSFPLQVYLEISSNSVNDTLLLSVEALDWIDVTTSRLSNAASRRRPPVRGMRWEGKNRYVDVLIPPLKSISIPFLALICQEGVYDVKRFRVTVGFTNDLLTAPMNKILPGASYVSVLQSAT